MTTNNREKAMDAALDYLASCTREGIDWAEILRMRAAGVSTSEIDHWVREHRTSDAPDQETSPLRTNHENKTDGSSQNLGTPKVINRVDLSGAKPATTGVRRGGLSPLANYVGGRLDGQITQHGFHDLFRDEYGRNLDGRCIPANYYRLYLDGCNLRYVHNSIIADHGEDPPEAG